MDRGSETQLQVAANLNFFTRCSKWAVVTSVSVVADIGESVVPKVLVLYWADKGQGNHIGINTAFSCTTFNTNISSITALAWLVKPLISEMHNIMNFW